jgi:hypothetical protein
MIANLLALDVSTRYADLHAAGTAPDGLAWFSRCDPVAPTVAAALTGAGTGLVSVLSTTSPAVAGRLAAQVGVCVVHQLADRELAGKLAALTGTRLVPAAVPVPAAPFAAVPQLPAAGPPPAGPFAPAGQVPPARWPVTVAGRDVPGLAVPGGAVPFGATKTFVVPAETLCDLPHGEFVLTVRTGSRRGQARVIARARAVPGRLKAVRPPRTPSHGRSL